MLSGSGWNSPATHSGKLPAPCAPWIPQQPLRNPPQEPSAEKLLRRGPRPASRVCCGSPSVRPARGRAGDGTWLCKWPRLPGPAWLLERHRSDAPTASGQPVHLHWLSLSAKFPLPFPALLFSLPGSPSLHVVFAVVPAISWTAAACPVDGQPCSRAGLGAGTALVPAGSAAVCSNPPSRLPFARSWDSCQPMVRVQRRVLKGLMDGIGFTGTDGWELSQYCGRAAVPCQRNASSGCALLANTTPLPHACTR